MGHQGSLHVVWVNKGQPQEPEFSITFERYGEAGNATQYRTCHGEESLWTFLVLSIMVRTEQVEQALKDLRNRGSAEIKFLSISDRDLRRFKLA
jgi:hypothetical protein